MDEKNAGSQAQRKPWEQHLNEAAAHLEEDLRRVVRYVDEEVVPEVRRHGSRALRVAADRLRAIAEQMEERASETPPQPPSEKPRT